MNNQNVAHNFVYGNNGRGSNFSSSAGTLYSYGSILAIKKYDHILIDHRIANYSSTSQRHTSHLDRAIGYDTPMRDNTITIYSDIDYFRNKAYAKKYVKDELKLCNEELKSLLVLQSRARVRSYFDQMEYRINNMNKIISLFGVDKRSSEYKQFKKLNNIDNLKENYKDLIADHAKYLEKKRKIEINKQYKKQYKKIQTFTGMNNKEMKNYSKSDLSQYDFLRIKEDQLCTSQNLCVDLKEAKLLYKMLLANKNILGKRIGYYTILYYNEKFVKIGCHNILRSELDRVLS